jgi:hypothetical protein
MDSFQKRDLFHRTADLLEKGKWVQGHMATVVDGTEAYCLVGALRMVSYGDPYPFDLDDEEEADTAERYGGVDADKMIHWNDNVAQSVEEVVARLRQMAAGEAVYWDE